MLAGEVWAEEGSFFDIPVGRCADDVLKALTGIVYV